MGGDIVGDLERQFLQASPEQRRVLVDIHGEVTPQLLALIGSGGGQVVASVPRFGVARAIAGWDTPYPHAFEWDYFPGPERLAEGLRRASAL